MRSEDVDIGPDQSNAGATDCRAEYPAFLCPVCRSGLQSRGSALVCPGGHAFDRAREGYVNLGRGKTAGDSRDMLVARRRLLESGLYAPLSQALNTRIADELLRSEAIGSILDVGCGEGYYLRQIASYLAEHGVPHGALLGLDSSREAVRLAARKSRALHWVVADVWQGIPLADGSCAVLLNVFAPRNPTEFARVLRGSGLLLVVIPQPTHLQGLRSRLPLLKIEENKEAAVAASMASRFGLEETFSLAYDVAVSGEQLVDLISMSPSVRHLTAGELEPLGKAGVTSVDIRLSLLTFRRRSLAP